MNKPITFCDPLGTQSEDPLGTESGPYVTQNGPGAPDAGAPPPADTIPSPGGATPPTEKPEIDQTEEIPEVHVYGVRPPRDTGPSTTEPDPVDSFAEGLLEGFWTMIGTDAMGWLNGLVEQFSNQHIFAALGIPATSGLAVGIIAGLAKG